MLVNGPYITSPAARATPSKSSPEEVVSVVNTQAVIHLTTFQLPAVAVVVVI